ncbi:hypothetical protein [Arenimonas sp.]|uniref:hypothetical protein n=1 Tax=Arenimonas sp. TaxID=1872635 RepID=UPI0025E360CE|nr:hypothetical protein [Arenimonas sp.]
MKRTALIFFLLFASTVVACKQTRSESEIGTHMAQAGELLEDGDPSSAIDYWERAGLAGEYGGLFNAQLLLFRDGILHAPDRAPADEAWIQRASKLEPVVRDSHNPFQAYVLAGSYFSGGDEDGALVSLQIACAGLDNECIDAHLRSLHAELERNFSYDAIDVMQYFNTARISYDLLRYPVQLQHYISAAAAYRSELGMRMHRYATENGMDAAIASEAFCKGFNLGFEVRRSIKAPSDSVVSCERGQPE